MFEFNPKFDLLQSKEMELRIIEKFPGNDVLIPFYYYDIYREGKQIGKISVRIGDNYHSYFNGHIGYEINEPDRGHHYSLAALGMVLPVAQFHQMNRLYLTCSVSNMASRRIIELSGAKYIETARIPTNYFGWYSGIEDQYIYKLDIRCLPN